MQDSQDLYESVGGDQAFYELVAAFYRGVESDAVLRALYPDDLEPGKRHLAWFLIQRFGGPDHFNQRRGAPRLRMRHAAFAVTPGARDAWVRHMLEAVNETPAFSPYKDLLRVYFEDAATFLINRAETSPGETVLTQL